ncbi:MAG: adenosylcobalamin-dependent ribonucleoside-diphosphate reductase [Chloroflexi bacterium]|nr:adenosylcobalamin-dependent ribonucleoside-diphosphate reductase [Chloroflexota bacterium]
MLKEEAHKKISAGLLPTPPLPEDAIPFELTENAIQVFERRYARRGEDGDLVETHEETLWRVAYHVASAEKEWGGDEVEVAGKFYDLIANKRFFPNSPTWTGAGTPLGQLAACFVLPIADDMGRNPAGIFQTLRDAALIQQTGGGNGFSFSRLRPTGTRVSSSSGQATGPIGFLGVYDQAFGEIAQGGTRRGANMAVLRVDHPDIEEFITCKTNENAITNFNISVGITDAFMQAVENDDEWQLRFVDVNAPEYRDFHGTLDEAEEKGIPIDVYKTVGARDLFQQIVRQAHHNGEPGLLFLDAANRSNPVPHLYPLEATNPCGEQWLGPYENCCLGSINLAQHIGQDGTVDWDLLGETTELSTRFLDDVVQQNAYVDAVPQLKEAALRARRIGLGFMGLGDLMYFTGVRYGSEKGQEFAAQLMEFIRYHAMRTSITLAKERGSFEAIKGSIYDPEKITWEAPTPIIPYQRDFGRPDLDWKKIVKGIRKDGIRNAAQTTIAPTGTIATVSGCEGYGCEPVFALAYIRHVNDNGQDLQLNYTSPLFEQALAEAGLEEGVRQAAIEKVMAQGHCQGIAEIPKRVRDVFVVSSDISADEHVRMQAALQAFVDNSLSKTVNFPVSASEEDVAKAYRLAWELGCKGITVYVTGSRDKVVLETHATATEKRADGRILWNETKRPRPTMLNGYTYHVETPLGKAYVTINEHEDRQPFEVFVNTAKAGSETAAVSEAIGRLSSYVLRLASPVSPRERLREIYRQLAGIGGGRSLGFGANRVRSLPDGVSHALDTYLRKTAEDETKQVSANGDQSEKKFAGNGSADTEEVGTLTKADLCPECGQAALINEEGCRKCYSCGFSEC